MTGKPVTIIFVDPAGGLDQQLLPNRIAQLGGGILQCFCIDCPSDTYSCLCPACAWASAVSDAGESTCCHVCICMTFLPCYYPLCTTGQAERINKGLGGKDAWYSRCLCQLCCAPCSVCQMVRAINNAKSKGLLNRRNGAPNQDLMDR